MAIPCLTYSWALLSQTSVPCESPDILTNSAKVFGFVSTNICLTKEVPNSGIPEVPVGVPICSDVTPKASVPLNKLITFLSSNGIV